jgi:hypothetical protein
MSVDVTMFVLFVAAAGVYALVCILIEPPVGRWLARWRKRHAWRQKARKWRLN